MACSKSSTDALLQHWLGSSIIDSVLVSELCPNVYKDIGSNVFLNISNNFPGAPLTMKYLKG